MNPVHSIPRFSWEFRVNRLRSPDAVRDISWSVFRETAATPLLTLKIRLRTR